MRLINTSTLDLEQFHEKIPEYAILSHTWGPQETSYQEFSVPHTERSETPAYSKIKSFCHFAAKDGFEYVWVDTCSIDKSSSAEFQEAINSMYKWYGGAAKCYTYLFDLDVSDCFATSTSFEASIAELENKLRQCRWFSRGWTLQELIAPSEVEFRDKNWRMVGTKWYLKDHISKITGIPIGIIIGDDQLSKYNVAEKMSWASQRETTRIEDEAYSLMGIFNIHMPMLYGEGRRAFLRLQEEILRTTEDYSMFAWLARPSLKSYGLFAGSPADFTRKELQRDLIMKGKGFDTEFFSELKSQGVDVLGDEPHGLPPILTSRGIQIDLLLSKHRVEFYGEQTYLACLGVSSEPDMLFSISLTSTDGSIFYRTYHEPANTTWKPLNQKGLHFQRRRIYVSNAMPSRRSRADAAETFLLNPLPAEVPQGWRTFMNDVFNQTPLTSRSLSYRSLDVEEPIIILSSGRKPGKFTDSIWYSLISPSERRYEIYVGFRLQGNSLHCHFLEGQNWDDVTLDLVRQYYEDTRQISLERQINSRSWKRLDTNIIATVVSKRIRSSGADHKPAFTLQPVIRVDGDENSQLHRQEATEELCSP